MPAILGIDPGYRNLGLARITISGDGPRCKVEEFKTWVESVPWEAKPECFAATFAPSLRRAMEGCSLIAAERLPDFSAVGSRRMMRLDTQVWTRLGVVVGIWTTLALELGIPVRVLSPQQIKGGATGSRVASKAAVRNVIRKALPGFQGTDHEADAAAAALLAADPALVLGTAFHSQ